MAKKVGIMLSGCGVFDGTEIYEAAYTVLSVDQEGADYFFMAPNVDQMHVIDHSKGEPAEGESRNVLAEAARIARGDIRDVAEVTPDDFDALFFPGGYGAAKNLCTFAVDGPDCTINPDVERLIQATHAAGKPIGFVCIAPAIAAKALRTNGVNVTIGNDAGAAGGIEKLGGKHTECPVDDIVVDETNKVITAPAYMYGDASPNGVFTGINKAVKKVLELV